MSRASALMDRAQSETGLVNFGEDSFREGLERLVQSIDTEANFNATGTYAFDMQIVDLLSQRLQVEDWYARFPEIDDEQIVAPLIGLGLPRTGSTALACLLGEDPATRSLRTWESMRPCPPAGYVPESVAERIALAEQSMVRRAQLFPRMQQMLPSTATSPTECQLFMGHDFKSQLFQAFAYIPSYAYWLENEADLEPTYRHLKRVLKLLQWRCGGPLKWRIKNPTHSLFIETLDKVFPDARFVMTHRDIASVIPSVADVFFELSAAYCDNVDKPALAQLNVRSWDLAMRRMIAFRDAGNDHRFFDIAFAPFQKDPFPVIAELYDWLGEDLSEQALANMRAWRENTPRDKHGSHTYTLEEFGLDQDDLRRRFAFYAERYTV